MARVRGKWVDRKQLELKLNKLIKKKIANCMLPTYYYYFYMTTFSNFRHKHCVIINAYIKSQYRMHYFLLSFIFKNNIWSNYIIRPVPIHLDR